MNSKYTSKIKIFEDFFDDEEISGAVSDVSEPGSDELSSDSHNDKSYVSKTSIVFVFTKSDGSVSAFTINHKEHTFTNEFDAIYIQYSYCSNRIRT